MPTRLIKESIKKSPTIDQLSWFEEVMFYRLIVSADDYGRFDGRIVVLKNELFPTKDSITKKNIEDALVTLASVGLVCRYEANGIPYLFLPTWESHQQVRAKKSKYPEPDGICKQMISDDNECKQLPEDDNKCARNPIQSESYSNSNAISNTADDARQIEEESPPPGGDEQMRVPYAEIMRMYNDVCVNLPKIKRIDGERKKAVSARFRSYKGDMDIFRRLFEMAQNSTFLRGGGTNNWVADFDWLTNATNMTKVLEGKYDDRNGGGSNGSGNGNGPDDFSLGKRY